MFMAKLQYYKRDTSISYEILYLKLYTSGNNSIAKCIHLSAAKIIGAKNFAEFSLFNLILAYLF